MQASVHRFSDDGSGSVLLDDGREATFTPEVFAASDLRLLRSGQRVSVDLQAAREPLALARLWIMGVGPGETIR